MQLTFSKEVIVDRTYKCSVASFMKNHYCGYGRWENELDIYVPSATASGYQSRVFCIPLVGGELTLDFSDNNNVKKVLTRYLKEQGE